MSVLDWSATNIKECHLWVVLSVDEQRQVASSVHQLEGANSLTCCEPVESQVHLAWQEETGKMVGGHSWVNLLVH